MDKIERHDFILYSKQTYPPFGGGDGGRGFVEPVPEFYVRLGEACGRISDTLDSYAMLPPRHAWALEELAGQLDTFAGYADKIVAGQALTTSEESTINNFGPWLISFFGGQGVEQKTPVAVADVATDSNTGRVLHEGVGLFDPIVIIYEPSDGEPLAGLGYVTSHYEFPRSGMERMTDAEWQTQVISGTPPARAWWMEEFLDRPKGR